MIVGVPDVRAPLIMTVICVLDFVWFRYSLTRIYPSLEDLRPVYGLLAWICLGVGIATSRPETPLDAFVFGVVFGLVVYGTFNGTEATLRRDWRRGRMIVADVAWGGLVCGTSSAVSDLILRNIGWQATLSIGVALYVTIAFLLIVHGCILDKIIIFVRYNA